jgi:hypothetical protein
MVAFFYNTNLHFLLKGVVFVCFLGFMAINLDVLQKVKANFLLKGKPFPASTVCNMYPQAKDQRKAVIIRDRSRLIQGL